MPISRDDLERGRTVDSLTDRILEFLQQSPENAFTAEEIAVAIEHVGEVAAPGLIPMMQRGLAIGQVQNILSSLARDGVVVSRLVEMSNGLRVVHFGAR